MKPVLAIDLDGVIADFAGAYIAFHYKLKGFPFPRELMFHYNCFDSDVIKELMSDSEAVSNFKPIKGAIDGIKALSDRYFPHIVTARPPELELLTRRWLSCHLWQGFELTICGHHSQKLGILKQIAPVALIEDRFETLLEVRGELEIDAILLDQPYNRILIPKTIHRCNTWGEIVQLLLTKEAIAS